MSQRVSGLRIVGVVACLALSACGSGSLLSGGVDTPQKHERVVSPGEQAKPKQYSMSEVFSKKKGNPSDTVAVNKYIWNAAIEVLAFLPIESADPFTGLIVTGYGRPPGGRVAYRATILVSDPALDARSLNLSLMTRSGPVDDATRTAVEDAILTRARQLRVQDLKL